MNRRGEYLNDPTHSRNPGGRVEGVVQVLILLVVGVMAGAASFTHVHAVAASHGQPGWLAWADAIVLELMSVTAGLEIRRRHRTGRAAGFVVWVLIAAVVLSLSAQVVQAERSIVGWLAAALPALGFLACVKIVLTRTPTGPASDQAATPTSNPADRAAPAHPGPGLTRPAPARPTGHPPARPTPATGSTAGAPTPATGTAAGGPGTLARTSVGLVPVAPGAFTRTTNSGGGAR